MSKGSRQRPPRVSQAELEEKWERTFGGKWCSMCGEDDGHKPWCPEKPENAVRMTRGSQPTQDTQNTHEVP